MIALLTILHVIISDANDRNNVTTGRDLFFFLISRVYCSGVSAYGIAPDPQNGVNAVTSLYKAGMSQKH